MAIHRVLVFGGLFAAYLFTDTSWAPAGNRGADLDPGLAHFAFDLGNLGFANAWVSMGSFAAFGGWAVLTTGVFRRWLGWPTVASGVGLALSRVRLDDECVAAALRTFLDLGRRGVHPTPKGAPSAPATELSWAATPS